MKKILVALMLAGLLLTMGTSYYHEEEGWSYVDAFYFSTATLTTIGYGDLVPEHDHTKLFTSFYAFFGIGIMLYLISSVVSFFFRQQKEQIGATISRRLSKKKIIKKPKKKNRKTRQRR
jgi:hypothetical protein